MNFLTHTDSDFPWNPSLQILFPCYGQCFLTTREICWASVKVVNLLQPHHFPTLLVFAWIIWVWLIVFLPTWTFLSRSLLMLFSASCPMVLTYVEQNYVQRSTQRRQPSSLWGSHQSHLCKNFRKYIFYSEVSPTVSRKKQHKTLIQLPITPANSH